RAPAAIHAQPFHPPGTPPGSEFRVNPTPAGAQAFPKVAADSAGDFIVVWRGPDPANGKNAIFGRRFDANGTPTGDEVILDPATEGLDSGVQVAMNAAGTQIVVSRTFTVTAGSDTDIRAQ